MADEHLSSASLTWALDHILKFGDTDLFPPLFEFELVKERWIQFLPLLAATNLATYAWHAPRQWLIPKDQVSFRTATQLDPLDSVIFTALIHDCGQDLERLRIPTQKNTTYSYRVAIGPDGTLYKPNTRQAFWAQSKALAKNHSHVAVIDINDFYNQIDHSAVLAQLEAASLSAIRRDSLRKLLLRSGNGSTRGIPIGPHASHLLAEIALIPLDNFLRSQYRFTRYADDIYIFCKKYGDAQAAIFAVAGFLNTHQKLVLNRQKTDVKLGTELTATANRMMIDDPINEAEEEMLNVLHRKLKESGEIEADDYSELSLLDLEGADAAAFSSDLIESVLNAYLTSSPPSYLRLRWFLRRMAQIGAPGGVDYVASHIDEFAPAIVDAVRYLGSVGANYSGSWRRLGGKLIKSLDSPLIRASEYLQVSIIGLFWRVADLNHINRLVGAYQRSSDPIRREIVLASSAQTGSDWVRQHMSELESMDIWLRRAVLKSMSFLPRPDRQAHAVGVVGSAEELMTNSLLGLADAPLSEAKSNDSTSASADSAPTIGIITALPKEMAAMKALLIGNRRFTPKRDGGMKEYYLGELPARGGGFHKVALALSGAGNNQASARATNLTHDLPSVKHILMVGIAGGVPNPAVATDHVRLGDIVVSGEHGIKQYDFVKLSATKVEHRDPPRPPSSSLLEAVKFLESELLAGLKPHLVHIAAGLKHFRTRKPSAKYDVLMATGNQSKAVKHPRDPSRSGGRPRVFVGPIASANVLLKDAKRRDLIRDKFGVKAVEMEGSGIADASWNLEIGYLVIRGICDYCDSKKDDRWQTYAAVVAAAYTRALLESVPSRR